MEIVQQAVKVTGEPLVMHPSSDRLSAAVSLTSHVYFDTYNNPIQLFLPYSASCSGQWDFWSSIDYWKFRTRFYEGNTISRFHKAVYCDPIWNTQLTAKDIMVKEL